MLVGGDFTTHMDGYSEAHNKQNSTAAVEQDDNTESFIVENNNSSLNFAKQKSLKRLISLSKPEHGRIIMSGFTMVITTGVQLCIPFSTGRIIDFALQRNNNDVSKSISTLLLSLFGIMALAAYLTYLRTLWQNQVGHHIICRLRKKLYCAILSQDAAFFDSHSRGDFLSRLSRDADSLLTALSDQTMGLFRSIVMSLGAASCLIYTSWSLALVALTILPPIMMLARWGGAAMRLQHGVVQKRHGEALSLADEALTCIKTVQQFCNETYEARKYNVAITKAHDEALKTARLQAIYSALVQMLANGSMLFVLGYGGGMIKNGTLSPGSLAGFCMYSLLMAGNVSGLSGTYMDLIKSLAALDRLLEIIDREPPIPPPPSLLQQGEEEQDKNEIPMTNANNKKNDYDDAQQIVSSSSSNIIYNSPRTTTRRRRPIGIRLERVWFSYPTRPNVIVLRDFSLTIPAGKIVALVGASGQGKSTVAALLTRLYNIQSGKILIDDNNNNNSINIEDMMPHEVRSRIGIVVQEPLLFPASIAENIRYGNLQQDGDDLLFHHHNDNTTMMTVERAAHLANVMEFAQDLPQGLDTPISSTSISGGQKQRIAMARCLIKDPPILILDEATSALDAKSEAKVNGAIESACRGRSVLLMAHRLSTIRTADWIAVLERGRIVQEGTFGSLIQDKGNAFWKLVQEQIVMEQQQQEQERQK